MITRFDRLLAAPTAAHKWLPGTEAPQHPRQEETALQEAPKGLSRFPNAVDTIIPLGNGSKAGNDELRLLLRSLERNAVNVRHILLVTDCAPEWLAPGNGLEVVPCADTHRHNKDANIFGKVLAGMERAETADIVWTCDDCAVLRACDFAALPVLYCRRSRREFGVAKRWDRRMRATMKELGLEHWHFDTHTPQRWNRAEAQVALSWTPYLCRRGRCINTAVIGRMVGPALPAGAEEQSAWKETCQDEEGGKAAKLDKVFVAYNDAGFIWTGLRERLFGLFPEKSKWEK